VLFNDLINLITIQQLYITYLLTDSFPVKGGH
jgi:hypothetical protein